jgi:hypothetical protein
MSRSKLIASVVVLLTSITLIGCTPAATPIPVVVNTVKSSPAPIKTVTTRPTKVPTKKSASTAKPTVAHSQNTFDLQWEVDTGDITYLAAAKDGTLYGFTHPASKTGLRYVVISPEGKILKALDMPEAKVCAQGNRADFRNRENFTLLADGTLLCHKEGADVALRIAPDGTITSSQPWLGNAKPTGLNTFVVNNDGVVRFYDTNGELINEVSFPDGTRISDRLYITGNEFTYLTHDGKAVKFLIPNGLDTKSFSHFITPWDDLYLAYKAYDAIGNPEGTKVMKVGPDGNPKELNKYPWQERTGAAVIILPFVFYLPEQDKIYGVEDVHKLALLDRDYNTLKVYTFPNEVNLEEAFVGHDGALYAWGHYSVGGGQKKSISKYALK